jgi:predicted nucleotidyltransferase
LKSPAIYLFRIHKQPRICEMKKSPEAYRQSRDTLLARIVAELSNDEHFAAAWLTGSYSRDNEDEVSDLDLTVVVAESHSGVLCARQEQVGHKTTPERLALFSRLGTPALIHENNNNAPEGGTFTFVLYAESALMVDWIFIPFARAKRPHLSRLLFDKANITPLPQPEPEEPEQSNIDVAEQSAFFWMMTAITTKYIVRGDLVFVQTWLEELHKLIGEIKRRMEGISRLQAYVRGSVSQFQPTREQQIASLRELVLKMQKLHPAMEEFTGLELAAPVAEIEFLFSLAGESHASN